MPEQEIPLKEFILQPDTLAFTIRISDFSETYIREHPGLRIGNRLTGNYYVAYGKETDVFQLIRDIGAPNISVFSKVMGLLAQPAFDVSGITWVQQQPFLNLTGRGTLMAFIDTGIDYTLDAFRYEDGSTKIRYLWDQTIQDNPPDGYWFGTEYTSEQIDDALKQDDPFSIIPHRDTVGHGTFLASVGTSREPGDLRGVAPDADLIIVKLKPAGEFYRTFYLVPPDQENAYESNDVMLGIEYALGKATQMNRPISFCISLGTNTGGHDGSSIIEEYLSRLSYLPGVCVCTAIGNEAIARHHAMGSIREAGSHYDIDVLSGDNGSPIYINLINNLPDLLAVSVISPNGEILERVVPKSGITSQSGFILEKSSVTIQYYFPVERTLFQQTTIRIVNPSPGIWTLRVFGETIIEGTFHCWLPITGLVDPQIGFLAPSPNFTVCLPATAIGTVTCGAYNSVSNSLYPESSWGPTRLPAISPDLVAPGVNIRGMFPTGPGTMSGTSTACSIIAGSGALMLQWGIVEGHNVALNTYIIRSALIRGAIREPTQSYPSPQWGYGKLDLANTFRLLGVL
ncbi:MAG: S8 family peptidase [Anaerovoracaceae bacterium]